MSFRRRKNKDFWYLTIGTCGEKETVLKSEKQQGNNYKRKMHK